MRLSSKLQICDLILNVRLGCSAEERERAQEVRLNLEIQFTSIPEACSSDNLGETVCYAEITQILKDVIQEKEYQTVEHLAFNCLQTIRQKVPQTLPMHLTVHKVKPPLALPNKGVVFHLSEQPL